MRFRTVYLGDIDRAIQFVRICDKSNAKVYITKEAGRVNAKSLLGVLSFSLDDPVTLEIKGNENELDELCLSISEFIAH